MRVMLDRENIGSILQEMSNERQIPTESQKKVADFFVDLVLKLQKGDKGAIQMLNMSPQELQQLASQETLQTEAFENLRSKTSGLFGGDAVMKRYGFLIQSLGKHIWELEQDLKNTKTEDVSEYSSMLSKLQKVEPTLKPKGGFFQKVGYGVGRGVGTVAKIGSVGVLGSALGSLGLPAYAVGGIIGGGLSVLKNSQNTQMDIKTKLKQALVGAGLGAMFSYAFSKLQSVVGDAGADSVTSYQSGNSNIDVSSFDGNEAIIKVETDINNSLGAANGQLRADQVSAMKAKAAFLKLMGVDNGNVGTEIVDGVTQGGKRIITYKITRR